MAEVRKKKASKTSKKDYYRKKSNYKSPKEEEKKVTKKKTVSKKKTVKKQVKETEVLNLLDDVKKHKVTNVKSKKKVTKIVKPEVKKIEVPEKIEELETTDELKLAKEETLKLDTPVVDVKKEEEKNNYFKFSEEYNYDKNSEDIVEVTNITDSLPKRFYFSYEARVASAFAVTIILFLIAVFFAYKATYSKEDSSVKVQEQSTATYTVCQKDNRCLGQNRLYDQNNISYIRAGFTYNLKYTHSIKYQYKYYAVSRIILYDKTTLKAINQYEDELTYAKTNSGIGEDISFATTVDVNFDKYLIQARDYVSKTPNAGNYELEIVLYLDNRNKSEEVASITIPLNEEKFRIGASSLGESTYEEIAEDTHFDTYKIIYLILFGIFTLLGLLTLAHITDFINKYVYASNKYLDKLNDILTLYDDHIVNSVGDYYVPVDKKVIKVSDIKELVDVKKMVNKPIIYTRVNNIKSEFYLEDLDCVYKYTLKEADLED